MTPPFSLWVLPVFNRWIVLKNACRFPQQGLKLLKGGILCHVVSFDDSQALAWEPALTLQRHQVTALWKRKIINLFSKFHFMEPVSSHRHQLDCLLGVAMLAVEGIIGPDDTLNQGVAHHVPGIEKGESDISHLA